MRILLRNVSKDTLTMFLSIKFPISSIFFIVFSFGDYWHPKIQSCKWDSNELGKTLSIGLMAHSFWSFNGKRQDKTGWLVERGGLIWRTSQWNNYSREKHKWQSKLQTLTHIIYHFSIRKDSIALHEINFSYFVVHNKRRPPRPGCSKHDEANRGQIS